MEKWLSVSQISEALNIPETTVRRYLNKFDKYFRHEQRGRGKKYHPETIRILERITLLYNDGFETPEIEKSLSAEFAFTVEDITEKSTTTQPPTLTIEKQFEEFKSQQEYFNQELLKQLKEQQNYIKDSLEKRDRELMNALREIQETKKQIASTEEKKWWKFWK